MIWRVVSRYAQLREQRPLVDHAVVYATFDGLFQQALLAHLNGDPRAATDLRNRVGSLLSVLLAA